jgi:hypothetical protein
MKIKPVLLVTITLIIGFVLGMLTSAQIRFHKLKPVSVYFSDDLFREGFYKTIQPDDKQKVIIDEILDRYAKINNETRTKFRREFDTNLRSLRKELDSNLTREQLGRVKEMDEKRQEMMRNERNKHKNDSSGFRYNHRRSPDGLPKMHGDHMPDGPPPYPDSSRFPERDTTGLHN